MPDKNNKRAKSGTTKLDLNVVGYSGLKQTQGIIEEEFHPRLKGQYGPKVYREMSDNSSAIGAIQFIVEALGRQVDYRVEPADSTKEAVAWAEFLESCLLDMSITLEDLISAIWSFWIYGWSYFEIIYKMRRGPSNNARMNSQFTDGKIGWRKFAFRSQDSLEKWEFDEEGGLRGMHQLVETTGKRAFIPIEKSILFRTKDIKGNPEGRSIYRNAVIDYYYLKRISEIEAIGIERDMTGLITMEVPLSMLATDASSEQKALRTQFEIMLSRLKRDEQEYALVPPELDSEGKPTGFKLKLLSTGGQRQININEVKLFYKINILQSVMAQFIQLGMSNVGSFALASSQTNLFSTALGSYLDVITTTFNRFAVNRLMDLNSVPYDLRPELVHGDIESPPLAEIGAYLTALAGSGQLPVDDKPLQRKLLEFAGLPLPQDETETPSMQKSRTGGLIPKYHDVKNGRVFKAV